MPGLLLTALDRLPLSEPLASQIHFLAEKIGLESDGTRLGIALSDEPSGKLTFNLGTVQGDAASFIIRINYRYPVTKTYEDCAPILNQAFAESGFTQLKEIHKKPLFTGKQPPGSDASACLCRTDRTSALSQIHRRRHLCQGNSQHCGLWPHFPGRRGAGA